MNRGTVMMMAGGTGGHVFPALAVAAELQNRGFAIQWLGSEQGIENRLIPEAGLTLNRVAVTGLRGGGVMRRIKGPLMLLKTIWAARKIFKQVSPVLAVGFGGYASGPGGIAARLSGVPLVLHEQNARPGLTNRVLSKIAQKVLQGFPGALPNATTVGNPVRKIIAELAAPDVRMANRQGPLRVLVIGGSQGALALNTALPMALAKWSNANDIELDIRHQSGRGRTEEVAAAYADTALNVSIEEFIDSMNDAYDWADMLICRAGASTVCEVAAAGVAAVFVPLPTAVDDHQRLNACWLAAEKAARLLPQAQLNKEGLDIALEGLTQRQNLIEMASKARAMALPESAKMVADVCEGVLHV